MKSDGPNCNSRSCSPFDFSSLRLKMTLFLSFLSLNFTITFSLFFIRWQAWRSPGVTVVPVKEIAWHTLFNFLVERKKILQELCKSNFNWDEQVSSETIEESEQWKNDLKLSENINLDRCFKPPRFGRLIDCSLHHFSDASQGGYI